MAQMNGQLSTVRLLEAAEAAVGAAVLVWRTRGGDHPPYPADLMGGRDEPECLRHFTRSEVEQACEFLVRVHMLRPRPGSPAGR